MNRYCMNCGKRKCTTRETSPYVCDECSRTIAPKAVMGHMNRNITKELNRRLVLAFVGGCLATALLVKILGIPL